RHTEWFAAETLANYYRIEPWSDAHWDWIKKVAADMARHHQDMILTPFFSLVKVARAASGRFRYDFRDLDRWVRIFKKAGVDWIEGGHCAGRVAGWMSQIGWRRFPVQGPDGKPIDTSRKAMSDEEFEPWMQAFLQTVHAHLKTRGWHKRYVQHVADEPVPDNEASWSHCARRTRQWLPGVQTIDAVMSGGLEGLIDLRVPQIQDITPDTPRNPKEDLWSYVCLAPQGQYPNRFLDYPSIRNRIIFWLSWSLDLKGFLHWGYSHWAPWGGVPARIDVSPWLDASGASIYCQDDNPLPSGDTHIVYPGRHTICSSLRWEVIRKGMEDFELLRMLERAVERDKGKRSRAATAARRLLKRIREDLALSPGQHTRCDAALLAAREEAGELLARLVPDRR
ncbi:MAG TPA: DUF4091 domain-containing protein, partial [Sumerlaeia bacterium]|nr:DUF4091 domain-containing protein [Sumerlaeia bacterium]